MMYGYARCRVCGQLFEMLQPTQKVCTTWTTKYSRDACHRHWNTLYYAKKHEKQKAIKAKHRHKITVRPKKPNNDARVTMLSGCIIAPANEGRCTHYLKCKHQRDCLMAVPLGWEGFKSVDNCGFSEAKRGVDTSSQQEEYWGYHQALMIWD